MEKAFVQHIARTNNGVSVYIGLHFWAPTEEAALRTTKWQIAPLWTDKNGRINILLKPLPDNSQVTHTGIKLEAEPEGSKHRLVCFVACKPKIPVVLIGRSAARERLAHEERLRLRA